MMTTRVIDIEKGPDGVMTVIYFDKPIGFISRIANPKFAFAKYRAVTMRGDISHTRSLSGARAFVLGAQ